MAATPNVELVNMPSIQEYNRQHPQDESNQDPMSMLCHKRFVQNVKLRRHMSEMRDARRKAANAS